MRPKRRSALRLREPRRLPRSLDRREITDLLDSRTYDELISPWHAFRDARAQRRAVDWLLDQGLIDTNAAEKFAADHPEPDLP